MEPTLGQMSDYDRPLTPQKKRAIIFAFAIAVLIAGSYVELMKALS